MKNIFILFLLSCTISLFSQEKRKNKIEYINMSSLSITKNSESYFSNYSKDSIKTFDGISFDLNTIHGAKFFGYISISTGIGLDLNINKNILSTPLIFDLRVFSNKNMQNSMFAYLQTGKNIKWTNSFSGNGTTSKLGVGIILESNNIIYYMDVYKKSKDIEIEKYIDNGKYKISGFGISLGIIL